MKDKIVLNLSPYKAILLTGTKLNKAAGLPSYEDDNAVKLKLSRRFRATYPDVYSAALKNFKNSTVKAKPTDMHKTIAQYNIPVITTAIDGLFKDTGCDVLEVNGSLSGEVLFLNGNPPVCDKAVAMCMNLADNDSYFIAAGIETDNPIYKGLKDIAIGKNVKIIEIQDIDKIPGVLEQLHKEKVI